MSDSSKINESYNEEHRLPVNDSSKLNVSSNKIIYQINQVRENFNTIIDNYKKISDEFAKINGSSYKTSDDFCKWNTGYNIMVDTFINMENTYKELAENKSKCYSQIECGHCDIGNTRNNLYNGLRKVHVRCMIQDCRKMIDVHRSMEKIHDEVKHICKREKTDDYTSVKDNFNKLRAAFSRTIKDFSTMHDRFSEIDVAFHKIHVETKKTNESSGGILANSKKLRDVYNNMYDCYFKGKVCYTEIQVLFNSVLYICTL